MLVVLAACGSRTPPPSNGIGNVPPDAGPVTPPPLAEGCPATYAEIPAGGTCDPAAQRGACSYVEGSCWCGTDMPCSGVEWPEEEIARMPVIWQCTPTPPAVRADGCPGSTPQGACGQEGQSCGYGDCCYTEYRCDHGQWVMGQASCPP